MSVKVSQSVKYYLGFTQLPTVLHPSPKLLKKLRIKRNCEMKFKDLVCCILGFYHLIVFLLGRQFNYSLKAKRSHPFWRMEIRDFQIWALRASGDISRWCVRGHFVHPFGYKLEYCNSVKLQKCFVVKKPHTPHGQVVLFLVNCSFKLTPSHLCVLHWALELMVVTWWGLKVFRYIRVSSSNS